MTSSVEKVSFSVEAERDVDTFILDHHFRLVHHGAGSFSHQLPRGLYKFSFRRGSATEEKLVELPVSVAISPSSELASSSAVPLRRARGPNEGHLQAARMLSGETHVHVGGGSSIFVFSRANPAAPVQRDPAVGLTLHDLAGKQIADVAQSAQRDDPSNVPCAGCTISVNPGAYRLRDASGSEPCEMIIFASEGWQTQVFLLVDAPREGRDAPLLATASILMSRGAFDPESEMLRLADAARTALAENRDTMPRKLLHDLLDDKFESPMLGIYAAHALIASDARDALLGRVIDVLHNLIPGHPDLLALQTVSESEPAIILDVPPMLLSSWNLVLANAIEDKVLLPPQSLASRVPPALLTGTPWLIWAPDALLDLSKTFGHDVSEDMHELEQLLVEGHPHDNESNEIDLDHAEEEVYAYFRRIGRMRRRSSGRSAPPDKIDVKGLARILGTTVPQVQNAVSGLAQKLRPNTQEAVAEAKEAEAGA